MIHILTEKYRPKTLSEVIGQEPIITVLQTWIKSYKEGRFDLPHLLFIGRAGVGKTTTAKALARDLFGENWQLCMKDMNASDDRGIDVVRHQIKEFASSSPFAGLNLLFLDEADNMTKDAQQALRRIMEDYAKVTRFILSCNYPNKIIEPIRSRCAIFRFADVPAWDICELLRKIADKEGMNITDGAIDRIAYHTDGKVRDAINVLNQLSAFNEIKVDTVEMLVREKPKSFYEGLYNDIKNGDVKKVDIELIKMYRNGFNVVEFFDALFNAIIDDEGIDKATKIKVLTRLGDYDYYVQMGANELLQVRSCLWMMYYLLRK